MVALNNLALDKYVTEKVTLALTDLSRTNELKKGAFQIGPPNLGLPQQKHPADVSSIYVQVFPQTRGDETPGTLSTNQLQQIASLATSAVSAATAFVGALTGSGSSSPSDLLTMGTYSCSIDRSINSVGTWSINVKNTENWYKFFSPGDWVVIFLGNDIHGDPDRSTQLIGQIDRIQKNQMMSQKGDKIFDWTISGRDFGRVFEDTNVHLSVYHRIATDLELLLKNLIPDTQILDPGAYIEHYIKVCLAGGTGEKSVTRFKIPSGLSQFFDVSGTGFSSLLETDISTVLGHCTLKSLPDQTFMTLMDMIQSASNAPWNEYVFDIVGGKPTFTFQPAAFLPNDMKTLAKGTARTLSTSYVLGRNLGFSDHERINYIEVHTPTGTDQDVETNVVSARGIPFVAKSIEKYGLKKYEVTTEFAQLFSFGGFNEKTNNFDNSIFSKMREILSEYLFVKHKFLNGTITTVTDKGIPQVGGWIKLEDLLLKVEGIQIGWEFGRPIQTEITVTHGITSTGTSMFIEDALRSSLAGPSLTDPFDDTPIKKNKTIKSPKSGGLGL